MDSPIQVKEEIVIIGEMFGLMVVHLLNWLVCIAWNIIAKTEIL